jgi:oligosaccharide amylase
MRDLPLGNGALLVNFDEKYQIRDIYFPHVGQENHTDGYPFRFGVWSGGRFSWVFEEGWERRLRYLEDSLVTDVELRNSALGVELTCNDTVASDENVFLRKVRVRNLNHGTAEFRIFFHQDFRLYEHKVGDTAFYDPDSESLIHYKKHRYFLVNTFPHFDDLSTGRKAFRDLEGTWRDAEDGVLDGGTKTEGSVDSTIQMTVSLEAGEEKEFFYWIAAASDYDDAVALNEHVVARGPARYFDYTENYWRAWVCRKPLDFADLSESAQSLYRRSLLVIQTQTDKHGAIIAASDWDVTIRATDHYSYLWTRDGALIANALDLAGHHHISRRFFHLCADIIDPRGYFHQKYNADGSIASGWHTAWDKRTKKAQVPIQEDETGLVLWALWEHYENCLDLEFANHLYHRLVVRAADFMLSFRHEATGLPAPSWNLWEDRWGIHTFTCATVVGGLRAAANFARVFGEEARAESYAEAADEIAEAMRTHLFDAGLGRFHRSLMPDHDGNLHPDSTVDASLFGLFRFGVFAADDPAVVSTMAAVEDRLLVKTPVGGIARFEHDGYMRVGDTVPGNPWFICSLWLADHIIAAAKSRDDLEGARAIIEWTTARALPSGVLAEQLNPNTGEPASVSPLTWSHSTYVATVLGYLKARSALEV